MATVIKLKSLSVNEIVNRNNKNITMGLIPFGYPKMQVSKVHDVAFSEKINMNSFKVEQLIK